MTNRTDMRGSALRTAIGLTIGLAMAVAPAGLEAGGGKADLLRFAADMAKRGNWREAKYRWEMAEEYQPENPRIHNNLAVAHEALGQPEEARESYRRALTLAPGDERITDNVLQFERFWRSVGKGPEAGAELEPATGRSSGGKGKKLRVGIRLPVPARMELNGNERLLVASFLVPESTLLDINRELVRFLRSEFRKKSGLDVLEVTPAPAIPEQTLDDLLVNREFWKYLGREYEADLIVTGIADYDSTDHSGFRDVDRISPTTGQKVCRSEFVEQEKFEHVMDLLIFDGASGELRFRDRLQREAVFRGTSNDPISAFFELSESLAPDVLAIVRPRTRQASRIIFKN